MYNSWIDHFPSALRDRALHLANGYIRTMQRVVSLFENDRGQAVWTFAATQRSLFRYKVEGLIPKLRAATGRLPLAKAMA